MTITQEQLLSLPSVTRTAGLKHQYPQILDIRSDNDQQSLRGELTNMLSIPADMEMTLPFLLLYDNSGLQLFEKVTKSPSYYPTKTEVGILQDCSDDIVGSMQDNALLVELGSGCLSKTQKILDAFERSGKKNLSYFALDVDDEELRRSLVSLPRYQNVHCYGLWGTFEDGFRWMKQMEAHPGALHMLFLGSSIGNFPRHDAQEFLTGISKVLRPASCDSFFVAFDHCADHAKIWEAYHDAAGHNQRFLMNALQNANTICEKELFDLSAWCADGSIDDESSCHKLFFRALSDTKVGSRSFGKGDCVGLGHNIKYPRGEFQQLIDRASMQQTCCWVNGSADYAIYKLQPTTAVLRSSRPETPRYKAKSHARHSL